MLCHSCSETGIPDFAQFCPKCGCPLTKALACSTCGAVHDGGARFCANCGKALGLHGEEDTRGTTTPGQGAASQSLQTNDEKKSAHRTTSVTDKGRRWELINSLWIGLTFTFVLSWLAFIYAGLSARKRQWVYWGLFYLVVPAAAVVGGLVGENPAHRAVSDTITVAVFCSVGVMALLHALYIKREYLVRLEAEEESVRRLMSITDKGRRWKFIHSLWIGLTFTFVLSWLAFIYAGLSARKRQWIYWGLFYLLIPAVAYVAGIVGENPSYQPVTGTITAVVLCGVGVMAILHALFVRKEYLFRLQSIDKGQPQDAFYERSGFETAGVMLSGDPFGLDALPRYSWVNATNMDPQSNESVISMSEFLLMNGSRDILQEGGQEKESLRKRPSIGSANFADRFLKGGSFEPKVLKRFTLFKEEMDANKREAIKPLSIIALASFVAFVLSLIFGGSSPIKELSKHPASKGAPTTTAISMVIFIILLLFIVACVAIAKRNRKRFLEGLERALSESSPVIDSFRQRVNEIGTSLGVTPPEVGVLRTGRVGSEVFLPYPDRPVIIVTSGFLSISLSKDETAALVAQHISRIAIGDIQEAPNIRRRPYLLFLLLITSAFLVMCSLGHVRQGGVSSHRTNLLQSTS